MCEQKQHVPIDECVLENDHLWSRDEISTHVSCVLCVASDTSFKCYHQMWYPIHHVENVAVKTVGPTKCVISNGWKCISETHIKAREWPHSFAATTAAFLVETAPFSTNTIYQKQSVLYCVCPAHFGNSLFLTSGLDSIYAQLRFEKWPLVVCIGISLTGPIYFIGPHWTVSNKIQQQWWWPFKCDVWTPLNVHDFSRKP